MNAAQRIEKAMERVEYASTELLRAAAVYGNRERRDWQDAEEAREVQAKARRYAAAMRGLQRASAKPRA